MKKEERNACAIKTSIGGQALMEGIMMRGPKKTALSVRTPKGEIVTEVEDTKGVNRPKICKLPIIRGIFGYIDSMVVGYKALMRSAELAGLNEIVEEKPKKKNSVEQAEPAEAVPETSEEPKAYEEAESKKTEEKKEEKKLPAWVMTLTMIVSVVLGFAIAIGLFVYVPSKLFELFVRVVPNAQREANGAALNSLIKSAFEGVLKVILLVAYMSVISLEKDIKRTFMYHGAEHKTIFCYEAGLPLTVENVRLQRRYHPRCGTSFLILMVLVSIFISFFIDPIAIAISGSTLPTLPRVLVRLALIPLIVGLGYELIKFAGRHDNWFTRMISAPGVWLQHITVKEPTDDMIECAIASVNEVIPDDGSDRIESKRGVLK